MGVRLGCLHLRVATRNFATQIGNQSLALALDSWKPNLSYTASDPATTLQYRSLAGNQAEFASAV